MRSTAAQWPASRRAIGWKRAFAAWAAWQPVTATVFEFVLFGVKQAWACLFGGLMLAVLLVMRWSYPQDA